MQRQGFTLVEMLVVVVVLAIVMAIALPLYLRAAHDSERRACRANMQTIGHAEQAYRVRSSAHHYTDDLSQLVGIDTDMQALPRCPKDGGADVTDDYLVTVNDDGTFTVRCNSDDAAARVAHNTVGDDTTHGWTPGRDPE